MTTLYKVRSQRRNKSKSNRGIPGVGFKLTNDGDFDISDRKLVNIKKPENKQDAVNLEFLERHTIYNNDAQDKIISNVKDPVDNQDVVTKKYLTDAIKKGTLIFDDTVDAFTANHKPIGRVGDPNAAQDVVTKKYFDTNAIKYPSGIGYINLKEKRFTSCGKIPNDEPDTLIPVRHTIHNLNDDDKWSAQNKIISNVKDPVNDQDVVTLAVLKSTEGAILAMLKSEVPELIKTFIESLGDFTPKPTSESEGQSPEGDKPTSAHRYPIERARRI